MTPLPRSTSAFPASNCGLTRSTNGAPSGTSPTRSAMTVRNEMNDRSDTSRSKGAPTEAPSIPRTLVRSWTSTRRSTRSRWWSWPRPTSRATTDAAPCCRRQSVKPPVLDPTSMARMPSGSSPKPASAASSLRPPRLTKRCGGPFTTTASPAETIRDALVAGAPSTVTRPAPIISRATVRPETSWRRTSSRSRRRRVLTPGAP